MAREASAVLRALTAEAIGEAPKPAVPVRRSITPEYLVCLEDGKKLKMLKRHLRSTYGMTPDEYRQKWGLPPDYPMVAPNYAEQRSVFAKKIGLGRAGGRAGTRAGPAKKSPSAAPLSSQPLISLYLPSFQT